MKSGFLTIVAVVAVSGATALAQRGVAITAARAQDAPQSEIAALKSEIDALRRLVPSQSHAMADVDYHFSNLWFAAQNANWPLAAFYLGETRSHLNWAVRIRPVRRLSSGAELDLRAMLQGVENSSLAELGAALSKHDLRAVEAAYRQTLTECYACHKAAEKPYLRPRIPEAPATRMINPDPKAGWPQ